jgi:hypothetical protein
MADEITRAVLARDEIAAYLKGSHGESGRAARERIEGYLDELRTTQRYSIYRALKHPLYPILRKIERIGEHTDIPKAAARAGRVIYARITAATRTISSSRLYWTTTASGRRSSLRASISSPAHSV